MKSPRLVGGLAAVLLVASAACVRAQTLNAVADTFVDDHQPTMNFGADSFAEVGVLGFPKSAVERALLTFDLSSIPPGTPINLARLRFVITDASPDPPNFAVTVLRLAGGFDENTVTWDTQPTALPSPSAVAVITQSIGDVVVIDVTDIVRAQRAAPLPNSLSLRIAASDETPAFDARFFDLATKEANPPQPAMLLLDIAAGAPALHGLAVPLALTALALVGGLALRRRRA
jgi:hypothetical protein